MHIPDDPRTIKNDATLVQVDESDCVQMNFMVPKTAGVTRRKNFAPKRNAVHNDFKGYKMDMNKFVETKSQPLEKLDQLPT